jgi:hypothetical protein
MPRISAAAYRVEYGGAGVFAAILRDARLCGLLEMRSVSVERFQLLMVRRRESAVSNHAGQPPNVGSL